MQVTLKKNTIFGQRNRKENPYDSDSVRKEFHNAANTDFAATLSIGAATVSLIDIGNIKLKKLPQFVIGSAIILVAGAKLDSFVGNKIKQKYKDDEEKGKKIQLGYDMGISALLFPALFDLTDRTNTHKIKLLDPQHLKESGLSRQKMLGVFAGIGAIVGLGVAVFSKKVNSWIAQNLMGYKKEEN